MQNNKDVAGSCLRELKLSRRIGTVWCASCSWRSTMRRSKTCCTRTPLPGYCPSSSVPLPLFYSSIPLPLLLSLFFCSSSSVSHFLSLFFSPSSSVPLLLSLFFCQSLMCVLPCDLCSTQSAYQSVNQSIKRNYIELYCIMTLLLVCLP